MNFRKIGLGVTLLALFGVAQADEEARWAFAVEPYALISSIDGDASVGRVTGADVAVDFSDILEALELAGMIHIEAFRDNRWGLIVDYGFMKLGADISGPRGGVLDAKVRQGVFEAFAVRRFEQGPNVFDVYGGLRWWDNDVDVAVDLAVLPGEREFDIEEDWVDPVIGARWHRTLNDRWRLMARGDIGGFGIASDFTVAASLGAFYHFKSNLALEIAYRATWVDYADGMQQTPGFFQYDTVTHGPLVGLVIEF